jgi:hypothetical protein
VRQTRAGRETQKAHGAPDGREGARLPRRRSQPLVECTRSRPAEQSQSRDGFEAFANPGSRFLFAAAEEPSRSARGQDCRERLNTLIL